jgi:hypothetical protein
MLKCARLTALNDEARFIVKRLHICVRNCVFAIHLFYDQLRVSLDEKALHLPGANTEAKEVLGDPKVGGQGGDCCIRGPK